MCTSARGFEDFKNRRCDVHLCSSWRYFAWHSWPSLAESERVGPAPQDGYRCDVAMQDSPDPRFRELSADLLRGLTDNDLVSAVYAHVLHHVLPDLAHEVAIVAGLPKAVSAIYVTTLLDNEVLNGGFHQFFWNSSGEFALMALEGLERLGAPKHAAVLQSAIATFETERAVFDRYRALDTSEAFSESVRRSSLGALDEQYYDLGFDALTDLQASYIRSHLDEFESPERAA